MLQDDDAFGLSCVNLFVLHSFKLARHDMICILLLRFMPYIILRHLSWFAMHVFSCPMLKHFIYFFYFFCILIKIFFNCNMGTLFISFLDDVFCLVLHKVMSCTLCSALSVSHYARCVHANATHLQVFHHMSWKSWVGWLFRPWWGFTSVLIGPVTEHM